MNKFMGVFVNVTIWLSLDNTPFPICTQTQRTAYVKHYFAQRNRSNGNFRLHLCRRNLDSFGVISSSINYLCTSLERCPSGRRSTPGKCVYAKSVSRVRIPSSLQPNAPAGAFFVERICLRAANKRVKQKMNRATKERALD